MYKTLAVHARHQGCYKLNLNLLQASITTAHTLIVGAVCGILLGTALWCGAPSLVAGDAWSNA